MVWTYVINIGETGNRICIVYSAWCVVPSHGYFAEQSSAVMTEDMKERNSLSSIKGLAYVIGALVIGVAAPLILGDTSNKQGYINLVLIMTAVIFSSLL